MVTVRCVHMKQQKAAEAGCSCHYGRSKQESFWRSREIGNYHTCPLLEHKIKKITSPDAQFLKWNKSLCNPKDVFYIFFIIKIVVTNIRNIFFLESLGWAMITYAENSLRRVNQAVVVRKLNPLYSSTNQPPRPTYLPSYSYSQCINISTHFFSSPLKPDLEQGK